MNNVEKNTTAEAVAVEPKSERKMIIAFLLAIFLGGFGAHRFYMGLIGTGIIQLVCLIVGYALTFVLIGIIPLILLGIWVLVDAIRILTGGLKDADGLTLRK